MLCYYKNPEATNEVLKGEWLWTGDMARMDEEGFIYLVDRKKDVVISGGENLYPVQIEDFLRGFDKIKDVAVIGLPDPRLGEIAAAIRYANRYQLADLLIVGRGGGSIEDLWAFNDERVAYAIYESGIPVISAVGHEPDVTISDYVADLRAATPSNAAELAVLDQEVLRQNLDTASIAMSTALTRQLKAAQQHLNVLSQSPSLRSPTGYLEQRGRSLELLRNRMIAAQNACISHKHSRYIAAVSKLDAMSPMKVLTRGYSMARTESGMVLRSVDQVTPGEQIAISLSDGIVSATVMETRRNSNES